MLRSHGGAPRRGRRRPRRPGAYHGARRCGGRAPRRSARHRTGRNSAFPAQIQVGRSIFLRKAARHKAGDRRGRCSPWRNWSSRTAGPSRCSTLRDDAARALRREAARYPAWDLTQRQLCDLKLLLNGGFSPLRASWAQADYEPVRDAMRLADGTLWPIPVTLDVAEAFADDAAARRCARAARPRGRPARGLDVEDDLRARPQARGAGGVRHDRPRPPGRRPLLDRTHPVYVGGRLEGLAPADRLRLPPAAPRARRSCARKFARGAGRGWSRSRPATRCTARTTS